MLIFSLPVPRWKGDNDLPSNSNISKMAKVANIAFTRTFCRIFDKLSSGMRVGRLCTCGSQVIDVFVKVCEIIGISKIELFNFSGTERVKQNLKN